MGPKTRLQRDYPGGLHEAELTAGLNNTALQIGGALGVAIVTTIAVSRSDNYL